MSSLREVIEQISLALERLDQIQAMTHEATNVASDATTLISYALADTGMHDRATVATQAVLTSLVTTAGVIEEARNELGGLRFVLIGSTIQ